jgi:hypothetical protein
VSYGAPCRRRRQASPSPSGSACANLRVDSFPKQNISGTLSRVCRWSKSQKSSLDGSSGVGTKVSRSS